jgi:DNA-binding PadR family transcriptional regulator
MRGGPHFGAGPMFGGGRGRKRRGDVRHALLLLLAEEPRNGYQLMQIIEERSGGRWRPSPGSVYPSLSQLEDEGLIRAVDREGTKLFELTGAGRKHLAGRHDATPPWEDDDDLGPVGDLGWQIKALIVATEQVMHAGDQRQVERAVKTLADARRSLYRILAEDDDA